MANIEKCPELVISGMLLAVKMYLKFKVLLYLVSSCKWVLSLLQRGSI